MKKNSKVTAQIIAERDGYTTYSISFIMNPIGHSHTGHITINDTNKKCMVHNFTPAGLTEAIQAIAALNRRALSR